jgi:hypothetical protein
MRSNTTLSERLTGSYFAGPVGYVLGLEVGKIGTPKTSIFDVARAC